MGNLAAYLGPLIRIATILEQGSNGLVKQAVEHADGFGLGWYPADSENEPLTVSSKHPLWREAQILRFARRYTSSCVITGLRKIGDDETAELTGCQPFHHDRCLFIHDGTLTRFREVFERPLRNRLSDKAHQSMKSGTASELLFATWVDALEERTGPEAIANALEHMVTLVRDVAIAADVHATLAVVVADGTSLVTLRTATHGSPPPMFTIVADEGAPVPASGRVIATEPLFPGSWSSIDPHSLVIFATEPAVTAA
jgi:predicted glutamine amidotransferase